MLQNIFLILLTISCYELLKFNNEDIFNKIRQNVKSLGIKIIYNLIYIFSFLQIKYNQLYNYVLPFFKETKKDCINIKTRAEVFDIKMHLSPIFEKEYCEPFEKIPDFFKEMNNVLKSKNQHLIIVSDLSNLSNKCISKKILDTELELDNCDRKFDVSEIAFIALYLNYNNKRYHINLKTEDFNYYLVGNIINPNFLQYYVKYVLNDPVFSITNTDTSSYKLELMDHNVDMIDLNAEQFIVIEKNGYRIDHIKNKNELTKSNDTTTEDAKTVTDTVSVLETELVI